VARFGFGLCVCVSDVCIVRCSNDADTVPMRWLLFSVCVAVFYCSSFALMRIFFCVCLWWVGLAAVDCGKRTLNSCRM